MIKIVILANEDIAATVGMLADKSVVRSVIQDVMEGARHEWIKLAGSALSTTRRDYVNGIQKVDMSGFTASISLVGVLPNRVEEGMDAYDMHTTLLGPNVPVVPWGSGQKGKHESKAHPGKFYRVIPFKHQTPGSIGQGGGVPMGKSYQGVVADSAALGKKIHAAAKKLAATTGMPGEKPTWGGRLPAGLAPKIQDTHSTDIYAGMVKFAKGYQSATQVTYGTFRVISDMQPHKWHHPGMPGVHLADQVQKYIEKVATMAFSALAGAT